MPMATFYLLPPRACLEQTLGEVFTKLLPGLPLPADAWDAIAGELASAALWPTDLFFIPRDELPEGDTGAALVDGYGAEAGDRVIEVSLARPPRMWKVPADVSRVGTAR